MELRCKPTQTIAVLGMCLILLLVFSVSLKGFLTLGNMFALARNISILGILSLERDDIRRSRWGIPESGLL